MSAIRTEGGKNKIESERWGLILLKKQREDATDWQEVLGKKWAEQLLEKEMKSWYIHVAELQSRAFRLHLDSLSMGQFQFVAFQLWNQQEGPVGIWSPPEKKIEQNKTKKEQDTI